MNARQIIEDAERSKFERDLDKYAELTDPDFSMGDYVYFHRDTLEAGDYVMRGCSRASNLKWTEEALEFWDRQLCRITNLPDWELADGHTGDSYCDIETLSRPFKKLRNVWVGHLHKTGTRGPN